MNLAGARLWTRRAPPNGIRPRLIVGWIGACTITRPCWPWVKAWRRTSVRRLRSEEHTSELQSLMRNSYAVFCLKKKKETNKFNQIENTHYKVRRKSSTQ